MDPILVSPDALESKPGRFDTLVAVSIALISILGAVVGGVAARRASLASDAQRSGVVAAVNREASDVTAHTSMFQNLRAMAEHERLTALAEESEARAESAEAAGDFLLAENLRDRAQEYRAAAQVASYYYSSLHTLERATFDEAGYLEDQTRFAARSRDLNPEDDFALARSLFSGTNSLVLSVAGLSLAILSLTIAQSLESRLRYVFFALGALVVAGVLCGTLALELLA